MLINVTFAVSVNRDFVFHLGRKGFTHPKQSGDRKIRLQVHSTMGEFLGSVSSTNKTRAKTRAKSKSSSGVCAPFSMRSTQLLLSVSTEILASEVDMLAPGKYCLVPLRRAMTTRNSQHPSGDHSKLAWDT